MEVSVLSPTQQEFDGTVYYLCAYYFQRRGERLHRAVWRYHNGDIPQGCHVHHVDGDTSNNNICNLALMTGTEHLRAHMASTTRREQARENFIKTAVPAAKEWHASEEGLAWHSRHAKENWKLREDIIYECTQCGKAFKTKHMYGENDNTFCSNNCKSQFRRESGVDNEERTCARCGAKYEVNKYSKISTCSLDCAVKRRWGK